MKAVIFSLADKEYGADIAQVSEVLRMRKVTPVPEVAPFIEGVISLRGKVIPLINLRKKLSLESKVSSSNRILVTSVRDQRMGILVDRVQDVATIHDESITRPDDILQSSHYLLGVAKWEGHLVLLIDLTALLKCEEHESLQNVQNRVAVKKKDAS